MDDSNILKKFALFLLKSLLASAILFVISLSIMTKQFPPNIKKAKEFYSNLQKLKQLTADMNKFQGLQANAKEVTGDAEIDAHIQKQVAIGKALQALDPTSNMPVSEMPTGGKPAARAAEVNQCLCLHEKNKIVDLQVENASLRNQNAQLLRQLGARAAPATASKN